MGRTFSAARTGRDATVSGLARSSPGELAAARHHLEDLLAAARALHAAAGHDLDTVRCEDAGCRLAGLADGPQLCAVAHHLTRVVDGPAADLDLGSALEAFRSALTTALDAVRTCRQTAHPSGTCWFASSPHVDGCGEVLHLAHRTG